MVLSGATDIFQDSTFLSVSSVPAGFGSCAVTELLLFAEINQNEWHLLIHIPTGMCMYILANMPAMFYMIMIIGHHHGNEVHY